MLFDLPLGSPFFFCIHISFGGWPALFCNFMSFSVSCFSLSMTIALWRGILFID